MAGKTIRDKSGVITLETRDKKDKGQVKDEQGLRSRGLDKATISSFGQ